jgi:hypothetical protein
MNHDQLAHAYFRTTYIVEAPAGPIRLRIGERNGALDDLLAGSGVREWAFITAWNPGSFKLPPAENARNNADLEMRIGKGGYRFLPGEGVGDDGAWAPERSFLVLGIDQAKALALGRFYRQRAIVVGTAGGPPELIFC